MLCWDACLTGICANVQVLKKSSDRLLLVEYLSKKKKKKVVTSRNSDVS